MASVVGWGPNAARYHVGVTDDIHLSQAAHDRLTAEHEDLTTRGRIDIARKIQAARELGDLSENGDYHAAKEEQGKMEGRIMHLAKTLENAEIVAGGGSDTVAIGSIVELRYEGDDDTERYLVGSIEDGLGNAELLLVKSGLDGFASIAFASVYGWGVAVAAFTVLTIQGGIALGARALEGVLTDPMLDDLARLKVLRELRAIMAVYGDTCPVDLASAVSKGRENNGA